MFPHFYYNNNKGTLVAVHLMIDFDRVITKADSISFKQYFFFLKKSKASLEEEMPKDLSLRISSNLMRRSMKHTFSSSIFFYRSIWSAIAKCAQTYYLWDLEGVVLFDPVKHLQR